MSGRVDATSYDAVLTNKKEKIAFERFWGIPSSNGQRLVRHDFALWNLSENTEKFRIFIKVPEFKNVFDNLDKVYSTEKCEKYNFVIWMLSISEKNFSLQNFNWYKSTFFSDIFGKMNQKWFRETETFESVIDLLTFFGLLRNERKFFEPLLKSL